MTDHEFTDQDALAVIRDFLDERATAGVVIAKMVTDLTIDDGVVTATFDPAHAGITDELFRSINPFDNLAEFVGTDAGWATEKAACVRAHVARVVAVHADGRSLGSATAADLYRRGTGQ